MPIRRARRATDLREDHRQRATRPELRGGGEVTINELIIGVNIALGNAALTDCIGFDFDGNGEVAINELIGAVNNALNGCPGG